MQRYRFATSSRLLRPADRRPARHKTARYWYSSRKRPLKPGCSESGTTWSRPTTNRFWSKTPVPIPRTQSSKYGATRKIILRSASQAPIASPPSPARRRCSTRAENCRNSAAAVARIVVTVVQSSRPWTAGYSARETGGSVLPSDPSRPDGAGLRARRKPIGRRRRSTIRDPAPSG